MLSRLAKDQPYGSQTNQKKQQKAPVKPEEGFKLIALYLGDSDLCKTNSVYRRSKVENPNITRFKMLQTQKRFKS